MSHRQYDSLVVHLVQVPSFPTKVAMKLVWVWLGEGEPQGHPGDILKGWGQDGPHTIRLGF